MSTNDLEMLEHQRKRKKRVARMKMTIIATISIWMLVSFIAIIVLIVSLVKLNSKVNKLLTTQEESKTVQTTWETTVEETQTQETDANIVVGVDSEDNLAHEGDTHYVYLTFDCVPNENTNVILDALADCGVKATFFVTGDESEEAAEIYKRIVDEGHTLGMYSYCNTYSKVYGSLEDFENDFNQIYSCLYEITGTKSLYYRFMGGSGNDISNVDMSEYINFLNENGITYFDWNVSAGDNSSDYTVEDVVAKVTEGVADYKNSVVLLNDDENKTVTAESIDELVQALQASGDVILPIDENTYVVQRVKIDSAE